MKGKVCLVTGATLGIGKVSALELARAGASVVLVARNKERGEAVVGEIKKATGNDAVELLLADLSSMAEVRRVAAAFREKHDQLHVLLNNAGAVNASRKLTVDGFELTLAVNHLAYFLLTHELLPVLEKTGKPGANARVVSVASNAHRRGKLDLDDLQSAKGMYLHLRVYGTSKLMNIMWTYELARRLAAAGKPVTANCLHPGVIATGFGLNEKGLLNLAIRVGQLFMTTPEKGARTQLWAATAPELEGVTGKYLDKCKEARSNRASHDVEKQRILWEKTEKLLGLA
jgi:NAD(P)-dependent dehydrogenase (short-subunit alcohol dehydrogenase family)